MEYRQLGTSGVRVSTIAYGTFPLGTYTDTAAGVAMIHAAMDRGVNFIDTANNYFHGRSEEIVGAGAQRMARQGRSRQQGRFAWLDPAPTKVARRATTSAVKSRVRCGVCRPTTSTYTTSTSRIQPRPSKSPSAPWTTWCSRAKCAISALPTLPRGRLCTASGWRSATGLPPGS